MNVLRIAYKELLMLRDPKMIAYLLITPVALVVILGTALADAFHGGIVVGDVRVLYDDSRAGTEPAERWKAYAQAAETQGVRFEPAADGVDGKREAADGQYAGYVEITDEGMAYYNSGARPLESRIAQSALEAFAGRYALAEAAEGNEAGEMEENRPTRSPRSLGIESGVGANGAQSGADGAPSGSGKLSEHAPAQWFLIGAENAKIVEVTALEADASDRPRAIDYYAIAMTTLIVLFSALTAAQLMDAERTRRTSLRLIAAPVTKADIFAGKILGFFLMNSLTVVLVVLITKYVFQANWGDHLLPVLVVLLSEVVFALGLGLGVSYVVKGAAAGFVIMVFVQLAALFGGSYYPMDEASGVFRAISRLMPLKWTNEAILQVIFADNHAMVWPAAGWNIGLAVLLLTVAAISMRRREGL